MKCNKCKKENKENSKFCAHCGNDMSKIVADHSAKSTNLTGQTSLYSDGWIKNGFVTSSNQRFDIFILKKHIYVIKIPKTYGSLWGALIGVLVASLLGMFIGAVIGENSDKTKAKIKRRLWTDENENVISDEYENYLYAKIPIDDIQSKLSMEKKNLIKISDGDNEITLRNNKDYKRVKDCLIK